MQLTNAAIHLNRTHDTSSVFQHMKICLLVSNVQKLLLFKVAAVAYVRQQRANQSLFVTALYQMLLLDECVHI